MAMKTATQRLAEKLDAGTLAAFGGRKPGTAAALDDDGRKAVTQRTLDRRTRKIVDRARGTLEKAFEAGAGRPARLANSNHIERQARERVARTHKLRGE